MTTYLTGFLVQLQPWVEWVKGIHLINLCNGKKCLLFNQLIVIPPLPFICHPLTCI
uniref:Uncharacterized protein n=1 Tax=Rhizophora mucronata TaxID=61149 RepID=A0A2P2QYM8_RHIMU